MKLNIFSSSDAVSLCEHHSHKTASIDDCLMDISAVFAHCMKGLESKDWLLLIYVVCNAALKEKYENCKDRHCNLIVFSDIQLFLYSFYLVWFMGLQFSV